ncbi:MAG: FtsX-like permease family protein [Kiritimatiellia bacterium]
MKTRHLCAILGVAIAVGTVTFMQSLVATNDHQATAVAERLLQAVPVADDAETSVFALDYRPNGRVMQGPPMIATVATSDAALSPGECVVTRALFAQRRLPVPPAGTELTLVGRRRAHSLRIAAVIDWEKPLRGYPNVFVTPETADGIDEEWQPWQAKSVAELAPGFKSDAARNFDRAKPLLLWAAALTALCLLVNSLFLSIEAKRKDIAILRMVGLTRVGVVRRIAGESVLLTAVGLLLGVFGGIAALAAYVAADAAAYPLGMAVAVRPVALCLPVALVVAVIAVLMTLRPALAVRPLEAASNRQPRKKHLGMLIAFACGFGAFVAVEVWGGSLMSAFVPSPEWPDAIVSILPGGVSAFDIEKIRSEVRGVRRIHELAPLQVNLEPLEELKGLGAMPGASGKPGGAPGGGPGGGRGKAYRNALLLGSDWLPDFRFVAGEREAAERAIQSGDACVITEMMARARQLKLGDDLRLDCGRGLKLALKIVGIVDLNWHMVTSRGMVRGLNRMPANTDGPAFVSFDTVEACDARPATFVKMTHLWLDYEPDFLKTNGVFAAGRIVEREIAETLDCMTEEAGDNTVRLHARDEVADGTLAHGVDIIGSMARVPFVFILVISLGFVAMLVASAEARRREFAVLRAVGATRTQIAGVLVGEALQVAGWGVVIGLAGGAAVGWLCTAGTRAAMANWGLPASFAIPYATVAKGALGAIAFALLIAVPTALVLVRGTARRQAVRRPLDGGRRESV